MKKFIYLDNNATTKTDPEVLEVMKKYYLEMYANPSSIHDFGQKVRQDLEKAREKVANFLGCSPEEIIFTSSGTEAINTAIKGIAFANMEKGKHIITSQIEHKAVLNTCKYLSERFGFEITYLPVDKYGMVSPEDVKKSIRKDTILITIMFANNEIGTIQPIKEISEIARENGIYFHTDAVQAVGKVDFKIKDIGVHSLSLSGHKFYGPKGIGVLYIEKGIEFDPLLHGGGHEKGRRSGTENVPGILGIAKAMEIFEKQGDEIRNKMKKLRDKLEKGILEKIPDTYLNGHPTQRLPNTSSISFKGIEAESILTLLDTEAGICVSTGSACSSHSIEISHVLKALNLPVEIAKGTIRFSVGKFNTEEEIDTLLDVLPDMIDRLRKFK